MHQANARENGEFDFVDAAADEEEPAAKPKKGAAAAAYFTTQSKVSEESVGSDGNDDQSKLGGLPGQTPVESEVDAAAAAALGERIYGFGAKERKNKVCQFWSWPWLTGWGRVTRRSERQQAVSCSLRQQTQ